MHATTPSTDAATTRAEGHEYTVAHAARTAQLCGMRPSVLLRAFLRALEDERGAETDRIA